MAESVQFFTIFRELFYSRKLNYYFIKLLLLLLVLFLLLLVLVLVVRQPEIEQNIFPQQETSLPLQNVRREIEAAWAKIILRFSGTK